MELIGPRLINVPRFRNVSVALRIKLFFMLSLGLVACAPDTVSIKIHPTFSSTPIMTIGLVPFSAVTGAPGVYQSFGELSSPEVGPSEIRSSFSRSDGPIPHRSHASKESVPSGAKEKITEMVFANLKLRPGVKTLSAYEVNEALKRANIKPSSFSGPKLAQELGKTLTVDAVIVGQVRVYRERAGQKFAAIPAAVGFDVQLINPKTGTVMWTGDYFEEQKPFTEDFEGMVERGGKWVTAEELARSGVKRVMERLPLGR